MEEYLSINTNKRKEITARIKQTLLKEEDVEFAFVYGSFLDAPSFRDIDVGVYVNNIKKEEVFDYELKLSRDVADERGLAFDILEIKILNFAPMSFLNNIFSRGQLLFSKNDKLLSDLIESSSLDRIINENIAEQSLKELIPT